MNKNNLIYEEDADDSAKSLINYIATNFYRLASVDNIDNKSLILLVAAIGLLNLKDDQSETAARRLAQLAMSKTKQKKEK